MTLQKVEALIEIYSKMREKQPKNQVLKDTHEALLELWKVKKAETRQ